MKKILTFGTFDLFHKGHVDYLEQAFRLGEDVSVCIARDVTVEIVKGKLPEWNQQKRLEKVQSHFLNFSCFLGGENNYMKVIEKVKPDVIALGYDQNSFVDELKKYMSDENLKIEVIRLKAFFPEKYKSSKIRLVKR